MRLQASALYLLQVFSQPTNGHAAGLGVDVHLHTYLLSIGKDASVAAGLSALVGSMVHADVERRVFAQQALQSLQLLALNSKA